MQKKDTFQEKTFLLLKPILFLNKAYAKKLSQFSSSSSSSSSLLLLLLLLIFSIFLYLPH